MRWVSEEGGGGEERGERKEEREKRKEGEGEGSREGVAVISKSFLGMRYKVDCLETKVYGTPCV